MHIRRSDKGYEANFRDLDLYMRYAEEYFRREALRTSVKAKRVYVATDDVRVIGVLKKRLEFRTKRWTVADGTGDKCSLKYNFSIDPRSFLGSAPTLGTQ